MLLLVGETRQRHRAPLASKCRNPMKRGVSTATHIAIAQDESECVNCPAGADYRRPADQALRANARAPRLVTDSGAGRVSAFDPASRGSTRLPVR
jgi:hypothetical protein